MKSERIQSQGYSVIILSLLGAISFWETDRYARNSFPMLPKAAKVCTYAYVVMDQSVDLGNDWSVV